MKENLKIDSMVFEMDGRVELRLVAYYCGILSGVLNVANFGKSASTLFQVYVSPEARNVGVGTAMVQEACRQIVVFGSGAVSALVDLDGPVKFWESLGFKPAHIEGKQMVMSKRLSE